MPMLSLVGKLLTLSKFEGYRRIIGVVLTLASGFIAVLSDPQMLGECTGQTTGICGMLLGLQPKLLVVASYCGVVGTIFKKK